MRLGLAVAAAVLLLDQAAKAWIIGRLAAAPAAGLVISPFLNIVLIANRGVSFGMFNGAGSLKTAIFAGLAVAIVAVLLVWLARTRAPLLALAIGLVIGGAVGNLVDRLWRGAVVDFLDFHWAEWHFFVFNLADAAISVGVGLMLLDSVMARREAPN
jgi:signal peptidase II